jgi:hypothetical protein
VGSCKCWPPPVSSAAQFRSGGDLFSYPLSGLPVSRHECHTSHTSHAALAFAADLNNCICMEKRAKNPDRYAKDVAWFTDMGFDGVKIGLQQNQLLHARVYIAHINMRGSFLRRNASWRACNRQLWLEHQCHGVGCAVQPIRPTCSHRGVPQRMACSVELGPHLVIDADLAAIVGCGQVRR